jgi:hypothetical protein
MTSVLSSRFQISGSKGRRKDLELGTWNLEPDTILKFRSLIKIPKFERRQ